MMIMMMISQRYVHNMMNHNSTMGIYFLELCSTELSGIGVRKHMLDMEKI
jgi:hypothetical protein